MLRADVLHVSDTAEVLQTWSNDLRRYVEKRVDASAVPDLLQEISVRMHQHLPSLRDEDRVAPWVFRIARSVVTDHHRRQRPTAALPEDVADEPDDDRSGTARLALWLSSSLQTLPPAYRDALTPDRRAGAQPARGRRAARPLLLRHEVAGAARPRDAARPLAAVLRGRARRDRRRDRLPAARQRVLL